MRIDREVCIGCGECVYRCVVGAIRLEEGQAHIDREACVECGNCLRSTDCPTGALFQDPLEWPRIIRKCFSDNQFPWPENLRYSLGFGRGTEECKTNDRTGRFKRGQVGVVVDLGRPCTGAYLEDAERICRALLKSGAAMSENSPFTGLLQDKEAGILPDELRRERVLSCIIETTIPLDRLEPTLEVLREAAGQIDTVFSLGLVDRVDPDGQLPAASVVDRLGLQLRAGAKVNLGLGRPLSDD